MYKLDNRLIIMDNPAVYVKQEQPEMSFDSIILGINESLQLHEERIQRQMENYQSTIKYMIEVQEDRNKARHEELLQCLQQTLVLQQKNDMRQYNRTGLLSFPTLDGFESLEKNNINHRTTKIIFKVWNGDRTKKVFIIVNKYNSTIYDELISKASEKLLFPGHMLVTENDGTEITEDEILLALKQETLILLKENEFWTPSTNEFQIKTSSSETDSQIMDAYPSASLNSSGMHAQDQFYEVDVLNFSNNESIWINFEVMWEHIPKIARDSFERGEKDSGHIRMLVQAVVQQMREIRTRIPLKGFKYVAEKIANRYPRTFKDIDKDGVIIGDGFHSLASKLEDRNAYLNRSHKNGNSSDGPVSKKRRNIKAGCSNWLPPVSQDISASLKKELNSFTNKQINDQFYALLNDAYREIRTFLDKDEVPTVVDILTEWPILLKSETISWHFQLLTNKSLSDLGKNLIEKSNEILNSGLKKNFQVKITKDMPIFMNALEYISYNFNENLAVFINSTGIENLDEANTSPFILEYVHSDSKKEYIVYFQRRPVINCINLLQAVEMSFALYIIFNLPYPKDLSATMELIERYFCKIHPNDGSRFIKSKGMKRKVINFMVKLSSL